MRYGDRGPAVAFLQVALQRVGVFTGRVDGVFGRETQAAAMRFQMERGLTPDGVIGPETYKQLEPYLAGFLRHVVKSGDTFYRLARRYLTTYESIAAANPGVHPNRLQLGQTLVIPLRFPLVSSEVPLTSQIASVYLDGLTARYPFLRTEVIGESVMGTPLTAIAIGTGATEVFFNGAHHANEWITSLLLLKFSEEYASALISNGKIGGRSAEALYNRTTLYLVPVVNPDGVDLVTGGMTDGVWYEQALSIAGSFPSIPFPDGWKANIDGIDPNLVYPAGWQQAKDIKFSQGYNRPAPRDYVGPEPLSAPESRAVYELTGRHDFRLTLSYHTQGAVIFWQYQNIDVPRAKEIGEVLSRQSGYALADVPYASSFAGYKDWFIASRRRPGYTVEAGIGENPLPLNTFDRLYAENVGLMTAALELAN